jgi:hypothetical protein
MKKTLVLLALAATGFAYANAPTAKPEQPQTQQPSATGAAKPKPVEVKKMAMTQKDEEKPTAGEKPACPSCPEKPKAKLIADEKGCGCQCPTGKKEEPKTATAQTPVKTNAPKIALA